MNVKDAARERTWQISLTHINGSRNWAPQKPEDWAPQRFEMYVGKGLPNMVPQTLGENVQKKYQYVGYNATVPKTHHNGMENEYKIAAGSMSNNFY